MSGNSLSRPAKNRIRLLFPSQISLSLNWNRISFLVTEARAWNNSAWTVQIEAPMISPLYRYLAHPFRFSCKWFIPTSNRRVYNFFSYLIFFHGVCFASLLLTLDCQYITFMKTSLASHDSKFAPWLGNCLFWSRIKTFPKVEKLWTNDPPYTRSLCLLG